MAKQRRTAHGYRDGGSVRRADGDSCRRHPFITLACRIIPPFLWLRPARLRCCPEQRKWPLPRGCVGNRMQRLAPHGAWVVPIPSRSTAPNLADLLCPPLCRMDQRTETAKRNHDEILFWDHYLGRAPFVHRQTNAFPVRDRTLIRPKGEG